MIRATKPDDTPTLVELARETEVFKPHEIVALREVLDDYHADNIEFGHVSVTYEKGGIHGFAYFAPEDMTDNTWFLYWIAVSKARQGQGVGTELMSHVEKAIRKKKGRLLLIETSSLPNYTPTRNFYAKHGYDTSAVIRDYYTDGDDMVLFRKHLLRDKTAKSGK